jgi:hypothetical protein
MSFNPEKLTPLARRTYIDLGKQFGSRDTLAQASKTINALALYGSKLQAYGFSEADTQKLIDVRNLLEKAIKVRDSAQGSKKLGTKAYGAVLDAGKSERLRLRTILQNSRSDILESSHESAEASLRILEIALEETSLAKEDADTLAGQLDLLGGSMADPLIEEATSKRGGPEAKVAAEKQAALLRQAAREDAKSRGTPSETEEMDLYDGLIITLTRSARRAAEVCGDKEGMPALLHEFELVELYRSTGQKKDKTPEPIVAGALSPKPLPDGK